MSLRIEESDLEIVSVDSGGSPIVHYLGKPFTGVWIELREDSSLAWEQEYIDGYQEGWYRSYYQNGQKDEEYKSHNNVTVDDTYKHWNEKGELIESF